MNILMLANNPCTHDARIIREAEALAGAGHSVLVLSHWAARQATAETLNGVTYRRICVNFSQRIAAHKHNKISDAIDASKSTEVIKPQLASSPMANPIKKTHEKISIQPLRKLTRQIYSKYRTLAFKAYNNTCALARNTYRSLRKIIQVNFLTGTVISLIRHAIHYKASTLPWKPDVVHSHDLYTLLAGALIARKTGAKLIYDSHELETGRNGNFSCWELWLRARIEWLLIIKTDRVITVSDSIANYLQTLYSIPKPVVVLNAPATENYKHSKKHIRQTIGLSKEVPLAIYIGLVSINRGLEKCVMALVHARNLHLATIGPRYEPLTKKMIALANELGVANRLHFIDSVPHDEVVSFVRSADVSLIPIQNSCLSYKYCFPNKLLESLFAGLPIAVARLVELEKMVEITSAGLVFDETNPKSISSGIMEIIENREMYIINPEEMVQLRSNYCWERQCKVLIELYQTLELEVTEDS